MKELLLKVFSMLRSNKKKAFTGLILAVLLVLYRRREKILNYESILGKFQQKIMKQLELNIKQQQVLGEKLTQLESIHNSFNENLPNIKKIHGQHISSMFIINELKEDLKRKDLKPLDKQQLWDRFKHENLLLSLLVLGMFPLFPLIQLLKNILFARFVNQENPRITSKSYLELIEKVLDSFISQMMELGLKDVFFSLDGAFKQKISSLKITADLTFHQIFELYAEFENTMLKFVEKDKKIDSQTRKTTKNKVESTGEKGVYWKNGISSNVSGVDYDEIGNYLLSTSKNPKPKPAKAPFFGVSPNQKLSIPLVFLKIIEDFLSRVKSHSLLNDQKAVLSLINHLKTLENNDDVLNNLDQSPEIVDEHEILQKSRQERTQNEDIIAAESVLIICNELIDWLESRNFQVLYYHCLRFGFFKLKTRLMIHKSRNKGTDKLKLANLLTLIFRIVNEEFLDANSESVNEGFYQARVKTGLANVHGQDQNEDLEDMKTQARVLEEFEMSLRIKESVSELVKRIYLEEMFEEREVQPLNGERQEEGKEFNEIVTILKQLG